MSERGAVATGSRRILKLTRIPAYRNLFHIARALTLSFIFSGIVASGQTPSPTPTPADEPAQKTMRDPIQNSDEFKSKLTFGVYFTKDSQAYDLNIRHQFGPNVTAWIAGYAATAGGELIRVGGQYDHGPSA